MQIFICRQSLDWRIRRISYANAKFTRHSRAGCTESELDEGYRCSGGPVYAVGVCLLILVRTTSYARNDRLIWHQVIVVSRCPTRLKNGSVWRLGQRTVSPITNTEYAFAALTVLKTRSLVANAEGLNIIYEVSLLPPRHIQRKVLLLSITPRRRGDMVRRS